MYQSPVNYVIANFLLYVFTNFFLLKISPCFRNVVSFIIPLTKNLASSVPFCIVFKTFHCLDPVTFSYLSPWTALKYTLATLKFLPFFKPSWTFILSALAHKSSSVLENFSPFWIWKMPLFISYPCQIFLSSSLKIFSTLISHPGPILLCRNNSFLLTFYCLLTLCMAITIPSRCY